MRLTNALIGATAVEYGLPVVAQNADYDQMADAHAALQVLRVKPRQRAASVLAMKQLNLRIDEDLAAELKRTAAERGQSVNALASAGLRALVDPDFADEGADQIRERLRRAGLLAQLEPMPGSPPDPEEVAKARIAAGRGRPLSDFVGEDRGAR